MAKILAIFAILGALVAGVFASASQLNVDGTVIQVGSDNQLYCDLDGVYVHSYQYNDTDPVGVAGVTIKGVAADCQGARIGLRLDDGSGQALAVSRANTNPVQWWAVGTGDATTAYNFTLISPSAGDRMTAPGIIVDGALIEGIHVWIEGQEP